MVGDVDGVAQDRDRARLTVTTWPLPFIRTQRIQVHDVLGAQTHEGGEGAIHVVPGVGALSRPGLLVVAVDKGIRLVAHRTHTLEGALLRIA
jgi:hypothetical protein